MPTTGPVLFVTMTEASTEPTATVMAKSYPDIFENDRRPEARVKTISATIITAASKNGHITAAISITLYLSLVPCLK